MATKRINRIKTILVDQGKTNKWLAEQLGKNPATVSKWCTKTNQPSLEKIMQIADVLKVDVRSLICSNIKRKIIMTNLNSENLRAYMNNGVVYQLMNCLIETDEKETTIVKDFILSQISKKNGRSLTNVRPVRRVLMN